MSDNVGAMRALLAAATDGQTLLQAGAIGVAIVGAMVCQYRLHPAVAPGTPAAARDTPRTNDLARRLDLLAR